MFLSLELETAVVAFLTTLTCNQLTQSIVCVHRITKARVLTAREYVEYVEEKEKKEKASLSLFCSWYAVLYSVSKCLSWFDFVSCLSSSFLSVYEGGGNWGHSLIIAIWVQR